MDSFDDTSHEIIIAISEEPIDGSTSEFSMLQKTESSMDDIGQG